MPTTTPMSLKDFFKTIGTAFDPTKTTVPGSRTQVLPNGGGSYQSPTPNMSTTPNMSMAPAPVLGPVKPPVTPPATTPSTKKIFTGSTPAVDTQTPPEQLDYSKYTNPATGKPYTPQEYAEVVANRVTAPSIPKYAGDVLTQGPQTEEQLAAKARELNNERNDIAVGEKDPYKVASESGLQLTPAQLSAVESAYKGVYTPALEDVFAAISKKQKSDESAATLKNDLEKMKVQFDYDKKLKAIAPAGGTNTSTNQKIDNERAAQTLFQNNPIVKDYNTVIGQKNSLDRIVANGVGGPADVNAIFNFMKALDPNSVVRESEYDKAAASGNLFQGVFAKFNGYFKDKGGFLPANVRDEFQNLVNQKLEAQKVAYNNIAAQTKEIVKRQGLDPNNVVIDFSGGIENLQPNVVTAPDGSQVQITD